MAKAEVVRVLVEGTWWRTEPPVTSDGEATVSAQPSYYAEITLDDGDFAGRRLRVSTPDNAPIPGLAVGSTLRVELLGTNTSRGDPSPFHILLRDSGGTPIAATYAGRTDTDNRLAAVDEDWEFGALVEEHWSTATTCRRRTVTQLLGGRG